MHSGGEKKVLPFGFFFWQVLLDYFTCCHLVVEQRMATTYSAFIPSREEKMLCDILLRASLLPCHISQFHRLLSGKGKSCSAVP